MQEATEQYFSAMLFLILRKLVAPTFEAGSFFSWGTVWIIF